MAARPLVRLLEQMDDGLNLLNIILLAIAVGVFLKLRSVLGRRTGHERPPYDPYSGEAGGNDKVVTLPKRPRAEGESGQRTVDAAGDPAVALRRRLQRERDPRAGVRWSTP